MIVLATDFGVGSPYVGQMHATLHRLAPGIAVVDLFADLPAFRPDLASPLLAAYAPWFPADTVFVAVVDPGVGSERAPLMIQADGRWFVGPDNGLLAHVCKQAKRCHVQAITSQPADLSVSFHGRDLFAPAAASLARGDPVAATPHNRPGDHVSDDLACIVYIDAYGNAMTGIRARNLTDDARLCVNGTTIAHARVFADAAPGGLFWYANSVGLVELAANQASAARRLDLAPGIQVEVADNAASA